MTRQPHSEEARDAWRFPWRLPVWAVALCVFVFIVHLVQTEYRRHTDLVALQPVIRGSGLGPRLPPWMLSRLPAKDRDTWCVEVESLSLEFSTRNSPGLSSALYLPHLRFPELQELEICAPYACDLLPRLPRFAPHLNELQIEHSDLHGEWDALAPLTELRRLRIVERPVEDLLDFGETVVSVKREGNRLAGLDQLRRLTQLRVFARSLSAEEFAHINRLRQLEELELSITHSFDGRLDSLAEMPQLRYLAVRLTKVADVAGVDRLTQLTDLQISVPGFDDEHLAMILPLSGLKRLNLSTDREVNQLHFISRGLPLLEEFGLQSPSLSPEGIQALHTFPKTIFLGVEIPAFFTNKHLREQFSDRPEFSISIVPERWEFLLKDTEVLLEESQRKEADTSVRN